MTDTDDVLPRSTGSNSDEVPRRRTGNRPNWLAWIGVLILSVAAFANDEGFCLAMTCACLSFGMPRFRVARWLKRTDPVPRRGKICSRFYLAWGLWKIAMVAFGLGFLLPLAQGMIEGSSGSRNHGGNFALHPGFGVGLFLGLAAFLLSAVVTIWAMCSALRHKIVIWLGPAASLAYEANSWPPCTPAYQSPGSNRTKAVVLTALISVAFLFLLGFLITTIPSGSSQNQSALPVFLIGLLVVLIGLPVSILVLLGIVENRMIAPTPEACWVDSPEVLRRGR